MNIAIAYKGVYKISHIRAKNPINENFLKEVSQVIENHKSFFQILFSDKEPNIDYYFSTYETSEDLDRLYYQNYEPKCFTKLDSKWINDTNICHCQFMHYQSLLNELKKSDKKYDLYIFLRPDIKFVRQMNLNEIDLGKFNITIEHISGNCDDNFWILNQEHLDQFNRSINSLIDKNQITHAINHELKALNVPINYIEKYDSSNKEMGHGLFIFMR